MMIYDDTVDDTTISSFYEPIILKASCFHGNGSMENSSLLDF